MSKKRPVAVTVLGILNIVFGSLGLAAYLCCGLLVLVLAGLFNEIAAKDPQLRQLPEFFEEIIRQIPGVVAYYILLFVFSIILDLLLLIGGIGLLKMARWARTLCIVVAVVTIVCQVAGLLYDLAIFQPGMEKVERQMLARQGGGPPPNNPFVNLASSIATSILGVAYAVVLLIFLLNPRIAAAFREDSYPEEEPDDDGLGYSRRTDDPWE